jgi:hypothetical protein
MARAVLVVDDEPLILEVTREDAGGSRMRRRKRGSND